jgi:parallel beta-helix repeat protein
VLRNELLGNWVGIFLQNAKANTILENRASEGQYGLYLANSSGNEIAGNDLSGNGRAGLGGSLEGNKLGENKG